MDGWVEKKLGDVCETGAGGTPLKSKEEYYSGGTIPWLVSGEVSQRDISRAKNFISDAGLKESSAKLFPANTVLVAMYGATAGQVGILRFEACTNQAVCGILPNQQTIPEYIYYALLLKKDELVAKASGNAQPNISQIKIKNTSIPFPPLAEQRRIVAVLDEAFAGIDAVIANTEKNLTNARELFESYLNNVFTRKGDGWVEKKLGDVCETGAGGTPLKSKEEYYSGGTIPWLVSGEVSQRDISRAKNFISDAGLKESSAKLFPANTVLVAMYGATAGQVGILRFEACTNQAVCGILPNQQTISEYIYYALLLKKDELVAKASGNAQPNISQIKIKNTSIPFPPIPEQRRIVAVLDELRGDIQNLESTYQQKLDALAELKQSLLQKAFNGELTSRKADQEGAA